MTEQEKIKEIEELLDASYKIACTTEVEFGNDEDLPFFSESNPDYKFYDGIIHALSIFGYTYDRKNDNHFVCRKEEAKWKFLQESRQSCQIG